MSIEIKEIEEKIREIEDGKVKYIATAERQIAAFDGAISALKSLIEPKENQDGDKK